MNPDISKLSTRSQGAFYLSSRSKVLFLMLFIIAGIFLVSTSKAHAAVLCPNSTSPGCLVAFAVPQTVYNTLNTCDTGTQSPAYMQWLSKAGSPTTNIVNVNPGQASVQLQYNVSGAVCFSGGSVNTAYYDIDESSDALGGTTLSLPFNNGGKGTYQAQSPTFNFSPPGGFTTPGTYYVKLITSAANDFGGGGIACVMPGTQAARYIPDTSDNQLDSCPQGPVSFPITVNFNPITISGLVQKFDTSLSSVTPYTGIYTFINDGTKKGICALTDNSGRYSAQLSYGSTFSVTINPKCGSHKNNTVGFTGPLTGNPDPTNLSPGEFCGGVANSGWQFQYATIPPSTWPKSSSNPKCTSPTGHKKYDFYYTFAPTPFKLTPSASAPIPDSYIAPTTANFSVSVKSDALLTINSVPKIITDFYVVKKITPLAKLPICSGINKHHTPDIPTGGWSFSCTTSSIADSSLLSSLVSGDKICAAVSTYDGGNMIVDTTTNTATVVPPSLNNRISSVNCSTISDDPYIRVYGGDSYAGMSNTCSGGSWGAPDPSYNGNVFGFNSGNGKGSGAQLGIFALGSISSFGTSVVRAAPGPSADPANTLMFSNSTSSGNFGGTECPYDYFGDHPSLAQSPTSIINTPPSTSGNYYYGGNEVIGSGWNSVNNNIHAKIYVSGDIVINNNIIYSAVSRGFAVSNIPSISFIASGNIYINSSVTQLDGTYIAQPSLLNNNSGNIYTCTDNLSNPSSPIISLPNPASTCNNQLVVNGSLIAKKISFLRTFGKNSDATPFEYINSSPKTCANSTTPSAIGVCASEVINYTPESYIGSSSTWNIDYITSLPPVL